MSGSLGRNGSLILDRRVSGARAGLVRNRRSRRNRLFGAEPWWRVLAQPDLIRAEPESPAELAAALADFARREVGLVMIDGGDGTVREVLSALPQAYGEALPVLAVLASGTTNLIASDIGAGRADPALVADLARLARTGLGPFKLARRQMLEVSWPDGSHPPVAGMFLGAGAFTRATELSFQVVAQNHVDEGALVAATLVSALALTLREGERRSWLAGDQIALAADGEAAREGPRFLVLATTLQRLVLGLWPFWGEGQGLRYLDVDAPPRRLAAALPAVMYGRPRPWMAEAGYRSGMTAGLELRLSHPFILDGEHFEPGAGVRVRAGRTVDFLV